MTDADDEGLLANGSEVTRRRPKAIPIERLADRIQNTRPDTVLVILLSSLGQLSDFHRILSSNPKLIKLVLFQRGEDVSRQHMIGDFMRKLWIQRQIYLVFFIPHDAALGEVFFYNPFTSSGDLEQGGMERLLFDNSSQRQPAASAPPSRIIAKGDEKLRNFESDKSSLNNSFESKQQLDYLNLSRAEGVEVGDVVVSQRDNDFNRHPSDSSNDSLSFPLNKNLNFVDYLDVILHDPNRVKLNGYPLKCVLFASTMTFRKNDSAILRKKLTKSDLANPMTAFFGLDVEVVKTLSQCMQFTPNASASSDGKDYGYMVN